MISCINALTIYLVYILYIYIYFFFDHDLNFPAQLVGGLTLSDLLDKPWSQVSSFLPPVHMPSIFLSRTGFTIPNARRFSSNVANSRSRAFRYRIHDHFLCRKKSLSVCALGEN